MADILVIGPNYRSRLMIKNMLEGAGHTVSTAETFAQGHRELSQSGSDAVLTDLEAMPESEVLQSIAQLRAQFPRVKILVVARQEEPMDFLAVRMMGAHDVLTQPLETKTLLEAVQQALREQEGS